MSILTHLYQHPEQCPPSVKFLYSARSGGEFRRGNYGILFYDRLHKMFGQERLPPDSSFEMFITPQRMGDSTPAVANDMDISLDNDGIFDVQSQFHETVRLRRFTKTDLLVALGRIEDGGNTVAYVCGPPTMTDWAVEVLKTADNMREENVLCEKWWG